MKVEFMMVLAQDPDNFYALGFDIFKEKKKPDCINCINIAFANGLLILIDHNLGIQSLIILKTLLYLQCTEKSLPEINQYSKHTILYDLIFVVLHTPFCWCS